MTGKFVEKPIRKNYRFSLEVAEKLRLLAEASFTTETDVIETLVMGAELAGDQRNTDLPGNT